MGYRAGVYRLQTTSVAWNAVATTSLAVAPDTASIIDIRNARDVIVQVSTNKAANDSGDIDINVMTSFDSTTAFDDVAYDEVNIGDASVKSFAVLTGPHYMRLRLDNNSSSGTVHATAIIGIRA